MHGTFGVTEEPFRKVIEAPELQKAGGGCGMLAVHTSKADLYSRLWCPGTKEAARKNNTCGSATYFLWFE